MDQKNQEQPKEQENDVPTQTQTHNENQNQSNQIVPVSRPLIHTTGASAFSSYLSREQCLQRSSIYTIQQRKQQALQKKLDTFWANQNQEVMETTDFKANPLPLARIKKIMKADEGVSMISAEAPLLFAKACEMFITELTMRSWANTDADKRKTLQKSDIASAISRNDMFDFLVDIVPRETTLEHNMFMNLPRRENASSANVPYYYAPVPVPAPMPPSQDATGSSNGPPRMLMGRSLIDKTQYKKDGNSSDLQGSDD